MDNAKDEFINHACNDGMPRVLCAKVTRGYDWAECRTDFILKLNYSQDDFANFMRSMDFNYDDGYGGQELFGTIWYEDGTFSQRGEYDGSEWWEHVSLPEIPEDLR